MLIYLVFAAIMAILCIVVSVVLAAMLDEARKGLRNLQGKCSELEDFHDRAIAQSRKDAEVHADTERKLGVNHRLRRMAEEEFLKTFDELEAEKAKSSSIREQARHWKSMARRADAEVRRLREELGY